MLNIDISDSRSYSTPAEEETDDHQFGVNAIDREMSL